MGHYFSLARTHLGGDGRLELVQADAGEWILSNAGSRYDLIFADTWHGKYLMLEETLGLLKPGGIYVVDDMLPQPNWPEGHDRKAERLIDQLIGRDDLTVTRLDWSTGIIIGVRR
jgi:predicted O-methyltransferase YrrM